MVMEGLTNRKRKSSEIYNNTGKMSNSLQSFMCLWVQLDSLPGHFWSLGLLFDTAALYHDRDFERKMDLPVFPAVYAGLQPPAVAGDAACCWWRGPSLWPLHCPLQWPPGEVGRRLPAVMKPAVAGHAAPPAEPAAGGDREGSIKTSAETPQALCYLHQSLQLSIKHSSIFNLLCQSGRMSCFDNVWVDE